MNKKGNAAVFGTATTVALSFFFFIFLLFSVGVVLSQFIDTQNPLVSSVVSNETHFGNTTSGFNLSNPVIIDDPITVVNNSNSITQYTTQSFAGGILQINLTGYVNSSDNIPVGVTYSTFTGENTPGVNITRNGVAGLTNMSDQLPLMGTALVLGFLMMLMVAAIAYLLLR